ncbi:MAG: S1 family peptidase [bacterium]
MKINTAVIVTLLSLLLTLSPLLVRGGDDYRLWPYPLFESEHVLASWLNEKGFRVSRFSLGSDTLKLIGIKEEEQWEIIIRPHSPLATEIQPCYTRKEVMDKAKVESLWVFLDTYSSGSPFKKEEITRNIPDIVMSLKKYGVYIKARGGKDDIQLSGFVIDKEGLILSTAHDLQDVHEVRVIKADGTQADGRLLSLDSRRDLALIKVHAQFDGEVSLRKVRNLLQMEEKVYSITYSHDQSVVVHTGVISGPPRKAHDQILWQAEITVFQGHSGGPVFDIKGNLVGIVKGRYRGTDSIGFIIPIETIADFLREINKQ